MANDKQTEQKPEEKPGQDVAMYKARLPYHSRFEQEYGITKGSWRTLVEAIWPAARTVEAVQMALAYCKARDLDPFKRPVHIVPVYSSALKQMVETVWPGISEIRTTATRTKNYGGMKPTEFGPTVKKTFLNKDKKEIEVEFPEWCRVTVIRTLQGVPMEFPGPMVRWIETYAAEGGREHSEAPNSMWQKRPWGQIEKCAEAAALRRAFPEEVGNDYAMEEMEGQVYHGGGVVIDQEQETNQMPGEKGPPKGPPPVKGTKAIENKPEIPMETTQEREREPVEQERTDEESQETESAEDIPQAEEMPEEQQRPDPATKKKEAAKKKPAPEMQNIDGSTPEGLFNNLVKALTVALKQAQASADETPVNAWMRESTADRKTLPDPYQKRMRQMISAVYDNPEGGPDIIRGI